MDMVGHEAEGENLHPQLAEAAICNSAVLPPVEGGSEYRLTPVPPLCDMMGKPGNHESGISCHDFSVDHSLSVCQERLLTGSVC